MFLSQAEKKREGAGRAYIESRREDLLDLVPPNFLNILSFRQDYSAPPVYEADPYTRGKG